MGLDIGAEVEGATLLSRTPSSPEVRRLGKKKKSVGMCVWGGGWATDSLPSPLLLSMQWAVDFNAGVISGVAGIIVGQPFDTGKCWLDYEIVVLDTNSSSMSVKVRLQTSTHEADMATCFRNTVAKEGFAALYKGIGPPLATAAFNNAILFGAYAAGSRWFQRAFRSSAEDSSQKYYQAFVAGGVAGICQCVSLIPSELVKTTMQLQRGHSSSSSWECARRIYRADQGLRGLYKGGSATVIRETPAFGVYFAAYEATKDYLGSSLGWRDSYCSFFAGGLAGCLSWGLIYPIDVIKTRMMAHSETPPVWSVWACARAIYAEGGVKLFMRGFSATITRAFVVNAVIFPVYEGAKSFLER
jgi:solute carrier family 25 carnitine/acylcarnitine transporter 20/29